MSELADSDTCPRPTTKAGIGDAREITHAAALLARLKAGGALPPAASPGRAVSPRSARISQLPMLRNRMFPLYCSRAPLAAPLLAAPASAPEPGYSEQALEMSRLVCAVLWPGEAESASGDALVGETAGAAGRLLALGGGSPALADELLVQVKLDPR